MRRVLAGLFVVVLCLWAAPAHAQTACADAGSNVRYVKTAATGSGNGLTGANAMAFPATPTRGLTYCVADGSYGAKTFSTAGTTLITIAKCTSADGVGGSGFSASDCDGQATFGSVTFDSDYWVFDGQTRDESCPSVNACGWADETSYGFQLTGPLHFYADADRCGNDITVRYTAIDSNGGNDAVKSSCFTGSATDLTVYRSHLYDALLFAVAHMTGVDGCLFEENFFGPSGGKEAIRGQNFFKNCTIKRNIFFNACGDPGGGEGSCTCDIAIWDDTGAGSFDNNEIYGNIFWDTNGEGPTSSCVILVGGDDGSWTGLPASNTLIFNNTVVGTTDTTPNIQVNGGTGNICRNNLFYNNQGNPSVSCNTASNNGSGDESSDPFVNSSTGNFRLAVPLVGVSTGSPAGNATDIDGVTRGNDGVWDRGAFEDSVEGGGGSSPTLDRRVPFIRR